MGSDGAAACLPPGGWLRVQLQCRWLPKNWSLMKRRDVAKRKPERFLPLCIEAAQSFQLGGEVARAEIPPMFEPASRS